MKLQTRELEGSALNWAVATCEQLNIFSLIGGAVWVRIQCSQSGLAVDDVYSPSTNWAQGGPIIERERIRIDCPWNPGPFIAACKIDGTTAWIKGDTVLTAAMRCYVASKMGDTVEVPDELCGVQA